MYSFDLFKAPQSEGGVPTQIQLLPAGKSFIGRDGRKFLNIDFKSLLEEFNKNGMELPIDIEHSTDIKGARGEPAPAVGWIKAISQHDDGTVWGDVEWNQIGSDLISTKQYRYISPVFDAVRRTGQVVRLLRAGLTNNPNLHLTALNINQNSGETMDIEQELKETKSLLDASMKEREAFAQRALLAEAELNAIKQEKFKNDVEIAINSALKDGKIEPSSEGIFRELCSTESGLSKFKEHVSRIAPKVSIQETSHHPVLNQNSFVLPEEHKEILKNMGITEKQYFESIGG